MKLLRRPIAFLLLITLLVSPQLVGAQTSPADAEFFKGYYLQHARKDYLKAIKAYQKSLALDANSATRDALDDEMAKLQEELATADFAQLMPKSAFAYIEVAHLADNAEQVARLMGLTGREFSAGNEQIVLRIDNEIAVGSDFQISPALIRELKKIHGAAIAITDVDQRGKPSGLAVIHPGDSDLLTGLVDTGIQFAPASNRIEGYPTFQIENEIWIVKTKRLILVSPNKSEITNCLKRIQDPDAPSLASQPHFKSARANNENAAIFAFVDPSIAVKKLDREMQREFALAKMILDINNMNYVSASLQSTDKGIRADVDVDFQDDHNSFGYGLIRTVPLSKKAFANIPEGAVAVVGMGLNPEMMMAAEVAGSQHLTALDIGREIFANIEEVGMFVLPTASRTGGEVPNFGFVIASTDVEKSQKLWNTVLSLPSKMEMDDAPVSEMIEIEGAKARIYDFKIDEEVPPIVIARLNEHALIAGTHAAVQASIRATKSGNTLKNDSKAQTLWDSTTSHTAKAAFVHVGRAIALAATMERGSDREEMLLASKILDDLTLTLVIDEEPAHFSAELNAQGLPVFEEIIKTLSRLQHQVRHRGDMPSDPVANRPVEATRAEIQE